MLGMLQKRELAHVLLSEQDDFRLDDVDAHCGGPGGSSRSPREKLLNKSRGGKNSLHRAVLSFLLMSALAAMRICDVITFRSYVSSEFSRRAFQQSTRI
jgi:hypothetical protein